MVGGDAVTERFVSQQEIGIALALEAVVLLFEVKKRCLPLLCRLESLGRVSQRLQEAQERAHRVGRSRRQVRVKLSERTDQTDDAADIVTNDRRVSSQHVGRCASEDVVLEVLHILVHGLDEVLVLRQFRGLLGKHPRNHCTGQEVRDCVLPQPLLRELKRSVQIAALRGKLCGTDLSRIQLIDKPLVARLVLGQVLR